MQGNMSCMLTVNMEFRFRWVYVCTC